MELIFQEDGFLIKTLSTPEEHEDALRLRHDVFREELKWVPPSPDGLDRDEYDTYAHGIGVFNGNHRIVGHVRMIGAPAPFMTEKEFRCLLPEDSKFKKFFGMVEATRICVRKDLRTNHYLSMTLANLIYKAMYHWSKLNNYTNLLTIVEKRYYVLLKRSKFPFKALGDFRPMGEGVLSGIVLLNWSQFDIVTKKARPEFYEWFVNLPDFAPALLQSHGSY